MKETAENLAGNTLTEFDKAYQFVTKAIITVRRKKCVSRRMRREHVLSGHLACAVILWPLHLTGSKQTGKQAILF